MSGGRSAYEVLAMPSARWFLLLVVLVAIERLLELVVSRRHEGALRARGAVEVGRGHYPLMVALHALLLVAAPIEVLALRRPFLPPLGFSMLALVALTMALRYWVIATLGERWTTRVLVLPGARDAAGSPGTSRAPLVTGGPFRYLRHPNYLAVAIEVVALPLVHTAWLTALVFGLADLALLAHRIRVEDAALRGGEASGGEPPRRAAALTAREQESAD